MSDPSLESVLTRVEQCLPLDRERLARRLHRKRPRAGRAPDGLHSSDGDWREFLTQLQAAELRAERRRTHPAIDPAAIDFDPSLPIVARKDEIAQAIMRHQVIVVCGETGSGKTTQLPKICVQAGRGMLGMIGHTQPRRIAARSVAARIASELHVPLGAAVGYSVRFTDRTNPETIVRVMTDGILLAELGGSDRRLLQYDTLIIDEAHERSLNIDFLLGYLKNLLPRRPELKVIVTSATIDPQRFSRHFDDAPIIEVSGRTFPVEVRYAPLPEGVEADEDDPAMLAAITAAIEEAGRQTPGDALVFLSGEREIREVAKHLAGALPPGHEVLPLYARLSSDEQNRVFEPHPGRRIVLATNVAETSLTVPGIRSVIDPGLARINRYSPAARVQRLPIERISQASAQQRAGRCGRVAPGTCVRLYSEGEFLTRPAFTDPEILRSNLASVILRMKALRLGSIDDFPFIDRPRPSSVREGHQTLVELGAIDERGELTELGTRLARLPIDPRFGRMIIEAQREGALREALIIVSALATQDPRLRPHEKSSLADASHAEFIDDRSDFLAYLKLWEWWHAQSKERSGSQMRKLCESRFISFVRMREWADTHRQLHALTMASGMRSNADAARYEQIHRALLSGLISNVGLKTETFEYQGVSDRKFAIFPASTLFKSQPRWIMAAEIVETSRLYARTVARIQPEWIEALAPAHLIKRTYTAPHWNRRSAHVEAHERIALRGLTIVPRRRVHFGRVDLPLARETFIQHALVDGDYQSPGAAAERERHDALAANRALIASLRDAEHKARRRNLLVGPEAIFGFYDARLPPTVCNGPSFEKWRRKAEKRNLDVLRMQRSDVMASGAELASAEDFPPTMAFDGVVLPLEYRHEPGHADDGVTLVTPVEALRQISAERCEWLVPGLLLEKVTALIKALPKQWRVHFVPVPEHAQTVVGNLTFGIGVLTDAIARELERSTGARVPRDAWRSDAIADHLRMNFRIVRGEGKDTVATGRDLSTLRMSLASAKPERQALKVDDRFRRSGLTHWDFDDLPARVDADRGGMSIGLYPALVDQGDAVGVDVFAAPDLAAAAHRAGVRRLFALQVREELAMHVEFLPGIEQMKLHFAPLARQQRGQDLMRELSDLIVDRVFLRDDADVRSGDEFRRRLDAGWDQLWTTASSVADLVARVLAAHHDVQLRLEGAADNDFLAAAVADAQAQLAGLFPSHFLLTTPWRWLVEYPRFLNAIVMRLQKLTNAGLARDAGALRIVLEFENRWRQRMASRHGQAISPAEREFRWLIEELRVSLFAGELRTSVPVSAARLEKAWAQL